MYQATNSYNTNQIVHELMSRLKFIARVKKQEKINLKSFTFESNTLWGSLRRFMHSENRTGTLDFVKTTILDSFDLLNQMLTEKSNCAAKEFCQHIVEDLIKSKYGIMNLQTTYADDQFLCSQLQTLLQTIDVKIENLLHYHSELQSVVDKSTKNNNDKIITK